MTEGDRTKLEFIEGLLESLRTSPNEAELWANVADILLEAGQFESAVRAYDMALQLDANLHRAEIGLSVALDICGESMEAREPPKLRGLTWAVLQELETLVRGLREGRRSLFVDVHAIRLQRTAERRLAADPDDLDGLFLRSAFLVRQGSYDEAISHLDRILARDGEYPGAAEFREQVDGMRRAGASRVARPKK